MASKDLAEVIQRAEALAPDEQMDLIAYLVDKARQVYRASAPRRRWRELAGVAPYPLLGEDAQSWVSRTRREGDSARARQREETE